MEKNEELLIERHIHENEELRKVVEEHRQYEDDLERFKRYPHLTPEEEVSRKILQKKKLLSREKIASILERYGRT